MKTYLCPHCGREIREDELQEAVQDDVAPVGGKPPKHLRVSTEYEDGVPRTTIRHKRISPAVFFLVPFTCVWSGFSMAGIYGSQIVRRAFDLKASLFGIPFLIGSIFLVGSCLFMLFGKRVLTLCCGKGVYFSGVGAIGRRTRFDYNRETRIETGWTSYEVNGKSLPRLELKTPGNPDTVKICAGMDEDSLDYVAALLGRECRQV